MYISESVVNIQTKVAVRYVDFMIASISAHSTNIASTIIHEYAYTTITYHSAGVTYNQRYSNVTATVSVAFT